jgi:D-serine deaminase-like pyridoxal phosphate-dependent protein
MASSVSTPYLVIDKKRLDKNLGRMARGTAAAGIKLRPHVKTHKTPFLGKLQLASGATGITVATIGEAEVFAKKGFRDIFIAYPLLVDANKMSRLKKLRRKVKLILAVDSLIGAKKLAEGLTGIRVLVEIDSGHHRSGCQPVEAGELAEKASLLGLDVAGVFTFPGHSYSPRGIKKAVKQEHLALSQAVKSFQNHGLDAKIISTGSTPSAMSSTSKLITELRPGVYIFNDAQQVELGTCSFEDVALTVIATVVSASGQKVILDAGSKVLGADRATWATGYGRLPKYQEARITALSEHHATVVFPKNQKPPKIGSLIQVIPNHVCNAVNLIDYLYLKKPDGSVKRLKVLARGKNN